MQALKPFRNRSLAGNTHQEPIAFPVSRSPPEPCHLDTEQDIYMTVIDRAGALHEMLPNVVISDGFPHLHLKALL